MTAREVTARVSWMSDKPLEERARLLIKHTTRTVPARVEEIVSVVDILTLTDQASHGKLELNDLGVVRFRLAEPLAVDAYARNRTTGAFILIDETTNETVGAGMSLEQEHLKRLKEGFDLAAVHFPHVNSSGCVKVLTNFYSVPLPVGLEVQAKVHSAYVEIWHQGECVARHERCFNRQQKVLNLEHYLEALTKKPGAFAGSTPLEQWRAQGRWPASFDRFWEALKQRRGKQPGTRAMIDVLLLGRQWISVVEGSAGKGSGSELFRRRGRALAAHRRTKREARAR